MIDYYEPVTIVCQLSYLRATLMIRSSRSFTLAFYSLLYCSNNFPLEIVKQLSQLIIDLGRRLLHVFQYNKNPYNEEPPAEEPPAEEPPAEEPPAEGDGSENNNN